MIQELRLTAKKRNFEHVLQSILRLLRLDDIVIQCSPVRIIPETVIQPFKWLTLHFGVFCEPLAPVKYLVPALIFLPWHWWGLRINMIETWRLVREVREEG